MTSSDFITYFKKTYRNRTSSFFSGILIAISDAIMLLCCIGLSFLIINLINPPAINFRSFVFYSMYFPLILVVFYAAGLYPGIMTSPSDEIRKLTTCSFFCFIGICISLVFVNEETSSLATTFTVKIVKDSSSWAVISAFLLSTLFCAIGLSAGREFTRHFLGHFSFWGVPAVIYTTGSSGKEVLDRLLKRHDLGYRPAIIIDCNAKECSMYREIPIFPESDEILDVIKQLKIKVAILCDYEGKHRPIMTTYRYTIQVSKQQDLLTSSMSVRDMGGILGYASTHNLTRRTSLMVKRLIDLLLCLIAAPIFIPLSIIISFIIKVTSPGSIFYGHKRAGKNGKIIKCWKFRSMYKNSQEMLEEILATDPVRRAEWEKDRKFIDDPRITPFGKFLRKTSLDELPQLWNIFIGEMSFVGPRPVTTDELEKYGDNADFILSVTPGLSGMWQISGRSDTGYEERVNLDTYYIQSWSVWLDLWIIIKTVWVVLRRKGAY